MTVSGLEELGTNDRYFQLVALSSVLLAELVPSRFVAEPERSRGAEKMAVELSESIDDLDCASAMFAKEDVTELDTDRRRERLAIVTDETTDSGGSRIANSLLMHELIQFDF